jgi:hypothetical protein
MKKIFLTTALTAALASSAVMAAPATAGVPPVEYQVQLDQAKSEFFVVEVKGSSYERGYQHGKELRRVIRPTLARFKYDMINMFLEKAGTEYTYDDYKKFFFTNTGLFQTAQEKTPELVDEIRGIADGANLDFKDVFVYNLNFDETFWVLEKMIGADIVLAMELAKELPDGHCSHGSVWADGKASVGYTLDWARQFEGSQALIKHVKENGDVLLMTTYAGTLIGHGINVTHGYTFTPHSKFQLEHDVDNGLAQLFIYRSVIEAGSTDKALDFLKNVRPAAGLGYALTDKNGTRAIEISAEKAVEYKTDGNYMAIANVARVNNDLSSSYIKELKLSGDIDMDSLPHRYWKWNKDSVDRVDIIEADIIGKTPADMTPAKWEETFVKTPINKPVDKDISTSNLWHVVEIDGEYIDYWAAAGNPGNLPLEHYRFKYR